MTGPEPATIFINERAHRVRPGLSAAEAAAQVEPGLPAALQAGTAYLTDGRGIRLSGAEPVGPGAIIRIVRSARSSPPGTDADP